jgi:hypothetical protein
MAELRALPAPRAAGLRGRCHPLGPRRVKRRAARARALHRVRTQGRDHTASGLGRRGRRLPAVPNGQRLSDLTAAFVLSAGPPRPQPLAARQLLMIGVG